MTPADGIGHFNASLIMRACMADGQLLQPDAPALALDHQHLLEAEGLADEVDGRLGVVVEERGADAGPAGGRGLHGVTF